MKKYLYPLVLILAIAACKPKSADKGQADVTVKKTTKAGFHYTDSVCHQYAAYLKSLDLKKAESATNASIKYVMMFQGRDKKVCDTAFLIFNKFYADVAEALQTVNEKDSIDLDKYYGFIQPKPMPAKVAAYIKDLQENGFDLVSEEGDVYVSQDRDLVAEYFYPVVSPVMKEYLMQVNKENKQNYLSDGSLIIPVDSLVDRTVWWEGFEKTHPDFIWRHEVSATKKEYQFVLLVGSDNSPVFTPEDKKPNKDFIKAYAYLDTKYASTETNKMIKPYNSLLLKGDYTKASQLADTYQKNGTFRVSQ